MKNLIATLVLAGSSLASAQTILTTGAHECGLTADFNCFAIPVDGGGIVWISSKGTYSHFVQLSIPIDADRDALVGTANDLAATVEVIAPITTRTAPNAYKLNLASFSFVDSSGESHTGSGAIFFHYRYATGSGRGGGGSGWRLVADAGHILVN